MTQLSNNELLALTMLLDYKKKIPQGATVRSIVESLPGMSLENEVYSAQENADLCKSLQKMIEDNPEFGNYKLTDVNWGVDAAPMATFVNGDDIVIAFLGTTGAREWKDNVYGGTQSDGTESQKEALEYVKNIMKDLHGSSNITVTGHSKGANKAQYVTLMLDDIDRCVGFDGQGFSADFVKKHAEIIAQKKDKITIISAQYDVVNALLIDIAGTRLYVDCSDVPEYCLTNNEGKREFFYYHKPRILLDENGKLRNTEGVQPSPITRLVHEFSVEMTNIDNTELRAKMFEFVAIIIADVMAPPPDTSKTVIINNVKDQLLDLNNAEIPAGLIAYTVSFLDKQGMTLGDLIDVLTDAGFDVSAFDKKSYGVLFDLLLTIEHNLGADKTVDVLTHFSQWGKDHSYTGWDEVLAHADKLLLDFDNAETLSLVLAQVFEFCEERNMSYDEFVSLLKDFGISVAFLESDYAPILWNALFEASREISPSEFTALVGSIVAWSENEGLHSWDELAEYIKDDPLRMLDMYASCGLEKKTINKAIAKLLSPKNISALLAKFAQKHPLIAAGVSMVMGISGVRQVVEVFGTAVSVLGSIYLISRHIIKNWDNISAAIYRTIEEMKEKVGEFFSAIMQEIRREIRGLIVSVANRAITLIRTAKNVVNAVVDGAVGLINNVKDIAIKSINRIINFAGSVVYRISSRLFGIGKEPILINYTRLRDCVERMEAVARRVGAMDRRLDSLYTRLLANDIEQEKGVFTSLANMYHLMRADIAVDEGYSIRHRAQAISGLFSGYNQLERIIRSLIPG